MGEPVVSICIPAYQAAPFLEATMASVTTQTLHEWELVVVDNASTDNTQAVLARFNDPRIRVVTNPGTLPVDENWNLAVSLARAPLVKLLPADDVLDPECLAVQVADLNNHPTATVAACRRDFIDPSGTPLVKGRGLGRLTGLIKGDQALRAIARSGRNPIGEPATMMFRRCDFDAVGGFDGRLCHPLDLALAIALLRRGDLYGQRRALASFRIRPTSLSAGTFRAQGQEQRALIRELVADPTSPVGVADGYQGMVRSRVATTQRRLIYGLAARRAPTS